ncbi:thioredoxin fold domain-containing protein, partial [archaeon]|nr:thioredoxin fold domain-containing protein [archaeon]
VFEALAKDFSGRAYFAKVNVDENQVLARRYGVLSIPNFVLFMEGRPVDRIVGAVGKSRFEAVLNKHIEKK